MQAWNEWMNAKRETKHWPPNKCASNKINGIPSSCCSIDWCIQLPSSIHPTKRQHTKQTVLFYWRIAALHLTNIRLLIDLNVCETQYWNVSFCCCCLFQRHSQTHNIVSIILKLIQKLAIDCRHLKILNKWPSNRHDQTIYRRNNRQIGIFERACGFEFIKSEFLGQLIFHLIRRMWIQIMWLNVVFVSHFSTLELWN